MKNRRIEEEAAAIASKAEESLQFVKAKTADFDVSHAPPELRRKYGEALDYLSAWNARFAIVQDIMACRAFVVYDEGGELIVVKPTDGTAKLITKAEELGAKITKMADFP